jgi:hypothetical protein
MTLERSLLVVYDIGSLAPSRFARAAVDNGCEPVFVLPDSGHAKSMESTLQLLGSVIHLNPAGEDQLMRDLSRLNPVGITTFSEFQIGTTAYLADRLGLRYHAPSDLPVITEKDAQRQRLALTGVDSVRFRRITHVEQVAQALVEVGLPGVVKPTRGAASRNTVLVTDERECRDAVSASLRADAGECGVEEKAVILEEFLVGRRTPPPWGDYLAADCVAFGDEVRPLFVTSKFDLAQPFRERGGYGGPSLVSPPELSEALELGARAVRALRIRQGIADFEIKLTDRGPRVIEVNGRLGGWVDDLAMRIGVDVADVAVKSALGERPDVPPLPDGGPIPFRYIVIPPVDVRRVSAIDGVARLRGLKHVDQVLIKKKVGDSIHWRLGTDSGVAEISGCTDTHDQLAAVVRAIEEVDWIRYD